MQETYARHLRGFLRSSRAQNFRAWIYRILRNAFLTSRTGLKATATVPLDLEGEEDVLPVVSKTPESILLQRSHGRLLRQALEQLPVAYRMGELEGWAATCFDVSCNGSMLLKGFDIFRELVPNRWSSPSSTLNPARGEIEIYFTPAVNYPSISAIEIVPE